ncbi:MAG: hypothetical protein ACOC0N_10170 [Chroococcales cyanobacterium]
MRQSSSQDEQVVKHFQGVEQAFKQGKKRYEQLNELVRLTQKLPGLYKNGDRRFPRESFEEAYQEMLIAIAPRHLQNFFNRLSQQNVELSSRNAAFIRRFYVARLNKILRNKLVNSYRHTRVSYSLDTPLTNGTITRLEAIADEASSYPLEHLSHSETQKAILGAIQAIIEDTEGIFKGVYPKGYPSCTVSEVVRRRLQCQKWETIAGELEIPLGTLTSFWHRKCKPLLQQQLIQGREILNTETN